MTDSGLADLKAEHQSIRRQFQGAALATLLTLFGGTLFYHAVQHLSSGERLILCTVTLTTIGYGDIVPKTDAEKLFTVFYVLVGIGILGFFVNVLVKNAVIRRQLKQAKRAARR